ncbi:MAG: hypothetical protein JXQ90_07370 [Cyclobacteriaceae bacterium]
MPCSPFGSIVHAGDISFETFKEYMISLLDLLKKQGYKKLTIVHPSSCYTQMVSANWLKEMGFSVMHTDDNQHIDLTKPLSIHSMEKRKLAKLNQTHAIRKLLPPEYESLHQFIEKCRRQQGLTINIKLDTLLNLVSRLPDLYDAWVSVYKGKWTSAVLVTRVTPTIAYYYLPATDQVYKKHSPMVQLLDHIKSYYQGLGFITLDLGISSINGKKQEGLFQFKERMGAERTDKYTFEISLQ